MHIDPVAKRSSDDSGQRAMVLLTGTMIGVLVVAALYWVQVVLIPVVLAVLLTFVLGPIVKLLQKHGLPRVPSVAIVMVFATASMGVMGWLIARQMTGLVEELPNYEANIKKKIESVKGIDPGTGRLEQMFDELIRVWKEKPPPHDREGSRIKKPVSTSPPEQPAPAPAPLPVAPNPYATSWLSTLPQILGTAITSLGGMAFVLALTVFMLLNREDLRSRFLRLAGRDHLTLTTKAVDEAFSRISRYLLMQLMLNSAYGFVLTVGLAAMGVNHAILWGVLAAIMRYIPYIGAWIVGLLLFTLSVAISDGWMRPMMVFGLFLFLEILASNVVEPLLYGKSIGVSQVALLVAAAFWAFLWGPIGLVLSGPMTVCLVVLGKYVPQLKFIDVILGDEPALAPDVSFYQRLLAQDREEAIDLVLCHAKTTPLEEIFSSILVPALSYAKRDRARDELGEEEELFMHKVIRQTLRRLTEEHPIPKVEPGDHPSKTVHILACAAQDDSDVLALEMLGIVLGSAPWEVEILSSEMLASEIVAAVIERSPAVICIAALPPGGLSHARYLCKRLKAGIPEVKIAVGRWGLHSNIEENRAELKEVGADDVETTLIETRDWFKAMASVFVAAVAADQKIGVKNELAAAGS